MVTSTRASTYTDTMGTPTGRGNNQAPPPPPPGGGGGGGDGGDPNQGQAPQMMNQPAPFALFPAAAVQGYIDYSTKEGAAIYKKGAAPLCDEPIMLSPSTLRDFLSLFADRVLESCWQQTLTVLANGIRKRLDLNFGNITEEQLRNHVNTYHGLPTRHAQNSQMIYQCLKATLAKETRNRVQTKRADYVMLDGIPDGLLYLKAVLQTVQVDTIFTTSHIHTKLMALDTLMIEKGHNIVAFNEEVVSLEEQLEAHGETTQNLIINLWKGYKACTDQAFKKYIDNLHSQWKHGKEVLTAHELMTAAANEYQILLEENAWLEPSDEQKQIIALTAQVEKMKAQGKNKIKDKQGSGKNKIKSKEQNKKEKGKRKEPKYPAWKLKAPLAKESTTKTVKGKKFYWRQAHREGQGLWVAHTPEECTTGECKSKPPNAPVTNNTETNDKTQGKLHPLSMKLQAFQDQDEEDF